jgi:putative FmdB family regulatory protein
MPVYEFGCNACGATLSRFVRSIGGEVSGTCDRCGSTDLRRLVSKFAVVRAPLNPKDLNKQKMLDGVDFTNPHSMANFFRRMGDDFHDEPNEHMDEIIKRLDYGEPVEKALDLDMGVNAHHHHGDATGGESAGESSSD